MKIRNVVIGSFVGMGLAACAPADGDDAPADQGEASGEEIVQPDELPTVTASDNLMQLTCADFLYAARLATDESAGGAALAAQDELSNSLIWFHGYLYAQNPDLEVMSEQWMVKTVAAVYDECIAVDKPQETNLFEVATS
jgi:hypothetical protein